MCVCVKNTTPPAHTLNCVINLFMVFFSYVDPNKIYKINAQIDNQLTENVFIR